MRGAGVDSVADLQRRVLVFSALGRDIAGAEGPGDLEVLYVVLGDLVDRCVAGAGGCAAIVAPVGIRSGGGGGDGGDSHGVADHPMWLKGVGAGCDQRQHEKAGESERASLAAC